MHSGATETIERHVRGSLKHCVVEDNWPQYESFSPHVNSLAKEVLKHKKEWLSRSDIYSIFYDLVYEAIISVAKENESLSGNLWDLLSEEVAEKLVAEFVAYFESIPRNFEIYIPLPAISKDLPAEVHISDAIALISFKNAKDIPGGYQTGLLSFDNKFEVGKVYLRHRLAGYAGNRLENACIFTALNSLKIVLQQGLFREILARTAAERAGLGLFGAFTHHQIRKAKAVAVDITSDQRKVKSVELPIDLCRFLENIDINWEKVDEAAKRGHIDKLLSAFLGRAGRLIEHTDPEANRIRSAIKWCFDSYTSDSNSLAFLQVCIGLEALLGDDGPNGTITETLADRCAYLISSDIKGRKSIRQNFRELYKVRSKLVHGNVVDLDSDQLWSLRWGTTILEYAITKEIKHLGLEKT
jgi:hypothetical protein